MLALLGALLIKLDRRAEAEAKLRQVIAEAPTFAKPHEDLGHLLVKRNRRGRGPAACSSARRISTRSSRTPGSRLGRRSRCWAAAPKRTAAFERCFALSPERRLMALAAEHQKEGRFDEAEHLYRRILRHNPRNVDALRLLALIALQARSATDEAESLLEKAIFAGAGLPARRSLDLGRLRKEQDRYDEALQCFDRAIALDPGNVQAHYLRGATLAPASFTDEAIDGLPSNA